VDKVLKKKKGSLPVYTQLADIIKEDIATGHLKPGIRIPSEANLARQYNVSPMTVRQAVGVLVEEGLVERVHGSGTFVRRIEVGSTTFGLEALDEALSNTEALKARVLKSNIVRVSGIEGDLLQLEEGDPVILVERLIFYKDTRFCYQIAYLPFDPKAPVVESMLDATGLSDLFFSAQNQGYKKGELKLLPTHLDARESDLLSLKPDDLAFKLEYIYYNFKDEPCAYGWFLIPPQQMPMVSRVGVWNE
jgi:GntR family transcriptional regulator